MAKDASKHCLVAVDAPQGPLLCPVMLPTEATVGDALGAARQRLDDGALGPSADWEQGAVGIWGSRCDRSTVPADGDRIELYRALAADPRQRRRERARGARGR